MRLAVAADERTALTELLLDELARRGHQLSLHGALAEGEHADWAACSAVAARAVSDGSADQAIVCCWTGTGAALAANKISGARAALCVDAATAAGARRWNDANVLALSLRGTGAGELMEILDAWFASAASADPGDLANIARVAALDDQRARKRA